MSIESSEPGCHSVTGEEGFITKVAFPSIEHLEHLIQTLLPFGKPTSSIFLSTSLNHRPLQQP
ncbi:MAG: Lrp/AsnC ligand binding domain-containing protein [Rubrobacteraceae bacterium]